MLIVIEGGDGSGKSTVAEVLATRLGCEVLAFPHEGGYRGHLLRAYLREEWWIDGTIRVDTLDAAGAFLFQCANLANRLEQVDRLKDARLRESKHLVLVRYWESALIYGERDGLDPEWLRSIHSTLPRADLSILLDIPTKVSRARVRSRGEDPERYETSALQVADILKAYRELWKREEAEGNPYRTVDASLPLATVHRDVWSLVEEIV